MMDMTLAKFKSICSNHILTERPLCMFIVSPHSKIIMYTMGNTVQNQPLVVRRLYKIMALYGHFPSLQLITYCFSLISRTTLMPSRSTKVLFLWLIKLQCNAVLETHYITFSKFSTSYPIVT